MRKMMSKEVTFTTLKIAKLEVKEGKPEIVTLPDEIILGTLSTDKAQKRVNTKYKTNVTILETIVEDKTFAMPVEEFIKIAKDVTETTPEDEAEAIDEVIAELSEETKTA